MKEQEIRAKFQPKKCENQFEFDQFMRSLNDSQAIANAPLNDKERELNKRKAIIDSQMKMLKAQLNVIKVERLEIEQQKKKLNRIYHEIKHEHVELNPKVLKNEKEG